MHTDPWGLLGWFLVGLVIGSSVIGCAYVINLRFPKIGAAVRYPFQWRWRRRLRREAALRQKLSALSDLELMVWFMGDLPRFEKLIERAKKEKAVEQSFAALGKLMRDSVDSMSIIGRGLAKGMSDGDV